MCIYCSEHCCAEKLWSLAPLSHIWRFFTFLNLFIKTTMLVIKSTLLYVLGHSNILETRNVIKQTRSFILGMFGVVVKINNKQIREHNISGNKKLFSNINLLSRKLRIFILSLIAVNFFNIEVFKKSIFSSIPCVLQICFFVCFPNSSNYYSFLKYFLL